MAAYGLFAPVSTPTARRSSSDVACNRIYSGTKRRRDGESDFDVTGRAKELQRQVRICRGCLENTVENCDMLSQTSGGHGTSSDQNDTGANEAQAQAVVQITPHCEKGTGLSPCVPMITTVGAVSKSGWSLSTPTLNAELDDEISTDAPAVEEPAMKTILDVLEAPRSLVMPSISMCTQIGGEFSFAAPYALSTNLGLDFNAPTATTCLSLGCTDCVSGGSTACSKKTCTVGASNLLQSPQTTAINETTAGRSASSPLVIADDVSVDSTMPRKDVAQAFALDQNEFQMLSDLLAL
eukprot:GFYU01001525.1.p1 GENE.GFYU01001525.1~~GFYU01001525.1.p1  ORF type:complete len:295 (+),score=58.28 GFYU01001525.1:323-1207(+)